MTFVDSIHVVPYHTIYNHHLHKLYISHDPSSLYQTNRRKHTRLELRKSAQREHHSKTNLECGIILHRTAEVYTPRIALKISVGNEMNAVAFRGLHAYYEEAEEDGEGFAEN